MESTKQSFLIAKTALISSAITVVIVLGILFLLRDIAVQYITSKIPVTEVKSQSTAITSDQAIVDMIAATEPAVVSVVAIKDVPIYEQYFDTLDPWGFFNIPRIRSNGTQEREVGGGSGFFVSSDGMIVTNAHVVSDIEARYSVVLTSGKSYAVDVLATDAVLDIAILKISEPLESPITYLQFGDSDALRLGQTVVAIGNALAEFQNSVSMGVVSGLSRSITASDETTGRSERLDHVIQTDAAINPGNSGGPLLNLRGEVVGVNVATSRGADNISFALPVGVVRDIVTSVQEYGEIVRPYLGVRYSMINERMSEMNNLPVSYGALVTPGDAINEPAVAPDSPAQKAGLMERDIIISIDGEELHDKDLAAVLRTKKVGTQVTLKILRNGEEMTLTAILERAPS